MFRAKLAVVALVVSIVVSGVGVAASPVSAARYACGDWCNGKMSTVTLPNSNKTCKDDAVTVKSGYPSYNDGHGTHFVDGNQKVELRYSAYCQTTWLRITNLKPTPARTGCYAELSRYISKTWNSPTYACPANTGTNDAKATPMVNDMSPNGGQAASAGVTEEMNWAGKYYPATVSFNY